MVTNATSAPAAQGVSDQFANKEASSNSGNLSGYKHVSTAAEQFAVIRSLFPQAKSYDAALATNDAPVGSEGNFLILPWQEVAPTYGEAVQIILNKLSKQRGGKFYNYLENLLGPQYLREGSKKIKAMKKIATEQSSYNALVVSAQLGILHRGKSVNDARSGMGDNEFPLGAYEIGFILLTHPNLLQHDDDLYIDCAGDEYAFDADGVFLDAPHFNFADGDLEFGTNRIGSPADGGGSASAFIPPIPAPSE